MVPDFTSKPYVIFALSILLVPRPIQRVQEKDTAGRSALP